MAAMTRKPSRLLTVTFTLPTGSRGYYAGGPKTTPGGFRLEIVGTTGYILINDQKATIHEGEASEQIQPPGVADCWDTRWRSGTGPRD